MSDDAVPADLARLWRLPTSSRLGRPAELDVDRVVHAAVQIGEREGLTGVTLPKIAADLGVTKMALYPYVGSKAELFELMADLAIGPAPELAAEAGQWRAGLHEWATALRNVYRRHRWLPQLPIAGPPRGPNTIDWMESGLRQLRETGLDWATKTGIVMLVSTHVRQMSLLDQQLAEARRGTGLDQAGAERNYRQTLAALVDPKRFPESAELLASDVFGSAAVEDDSPDHVGEHDFLFGLELILNGVAVEIGA